MIFATVMSAIVVGMTPAADEPWNQTLQPALEIVFGNTWRIVVASILAFWIGDFVNAYVLARMKVWMAGRHLWMRTIGSTILGQGVDSLVFYPIAFYGIWNGDSLFKVLMFNFAFKVMVEVVMTPVTYLAVGTLKRVEEEDYYDEGTDFTPFSYHERGRPIC